MSCKHPIPAVDYGIDKSTGKRVVKVQYPFRTESLIDFKRRIEGDNDFRRRNGLNERKVLLLPCGKCIACKLAKRREWSVRCCLEAKYHDEVSFITLTYDDKHNPGVLRKDHFQKFIKELRRDHEVRYFGCGEVASRPHYHLIVFGYFPKDALPDYVSKTGYQCYRSEEVSKYWNKGEVSVQHFDAACAGYVAGYVNKKIGEDKQGFILMSKKPGIGYQYLELHKDEIARYYHINDYMGSIKFAKPPRYFNKLCEDAWNILLDDQKLRNKEINDILKAVEMRKHGIEHEEEYLSTIELFDFKKANKLVRGL